MTIPTLPPLPLEWREAGTRISPRLACDCGTHRVAYLHKDGAYWEGYANGWDKAPDIPIHRSRSLDKAKAAAEAAAQAEWQRFVNSMYGS